MDAEAELRGIVADNIRRMATERKITLPALADFAEVSRAQLYDVLAAKKSPTTNWLVKVAKVLEVEAFVLLKPPSRTKR